MKSFFFIFALVPFFAFSQKAKRGYLDSITTKSGWTIHVGDTVSLGLGTRQNGDFKYVENIGFAAQISNLSPEYGDASQYNDAKNALSKSESMTDVVITQIDKSYLYYKNGARKMIFTEPAIASGELVLPDKFKSRNANR